MAETVDDVQLYTPPSRPPPLAASCAPSRRTPSPPACDGRRLLSPDRGWYRPTPLLFHGTDRCAGRAAVALYCPAPHHAHAHSAPPCGGRTQPMPLRPENCLSDRRLPGSP